LRRRDVSFCLHTCDRSMRTLKETFPSYFLFRLHFLKIFTYVESRKICLSYIWQAHGSDWVNTEELLNKMEKVAEDFPTTEFNAGNCQEHRNDKISVSINTIKYRSSYKCWCPLVRNTLNTSLRPNLRFSSNLSKFFYYVSSQFRWCYIPPHTKNML